MIITGLFDNRGFRELFRTASGAFSILRKMNYAESFAPKRTEASGWIRTFHGTVVR